MMRNCMNVLITFTRYHEVVLLSVVSIALVVLYVIAFNSR